MYLVGNSDILDRVPSDMACFNFDVKVAALINIVDINQIPF